MKSFCIAALWITCASSVVHAAKESPPVEKAAIDESVLAIQTAGLFAIGGVGFAGEISAGEIAMRELIKRPDAVGQFTKMLDSATPAGRLYSLLGLRLLDKKAFAAALPRYKDSKTEVEVMSGCTLSKQALGDMAERINKGLYE